MFVVSSAHHYTMRFFNVRDTNPFLSLRTHFRLSHQISQLQLNVGILGHIRTYPFPRTVLIFVQYLNMLPIIMYQVLLQLYFRFYIRKKMLYYFNTDGRNKNLFKIHLSGSTIKYPKTLLDLLSRKFQTVNGL